MVTEFDFMESYLRGTASHEIYLMISTRPMDMVTLNFKKAPSLKDSLYDETDEILDNDSDAVENSKQDDRADINSITNGAITLTFGPMGVETLNGKPFTNELLWFNSSQGGGIFSFGSRISTYFKAMVCNLDFMCFDQIKQSQFQFRIVQMLKFSKGRMLNLQRSHGIHGLHKFTVSGGQMKVTVKVNLKSNGLLGLFLLMIIVDGTR